MARPLDRVADPSMTDARAVRRDLVLACRILAAEGHADNVYGHVSARLPGSETIWLKGAGVGLDEVREEHLVELSLDGRVGGGWPHLHEEWPIHTELMRDRPGVLSVVHTHPKFSIAFAARGLDLRPVSHEGSFFWPPGVATFSEFTDLVRTPAQGAAVSRALATSAALLLLNHGIAVVGASVAEACAVAVMLERAAEIQLLAQPSAETAVRHTAADEAVRKKAIWPPGAMRTRFEYLARKHGLRTG